MSITFEAQATRTLIQQDGVSRVAINDDGSMELLTPPSTPTGNMVTSFNQFGNSLTDNGWQKLPSGLIIQWGSRLNNGSVTFPVAFTATPYSVTFGGLGGSGSDAYMTALSNTGFTIAGVDSGETNYYIAIGN